MGRCFLSGFLSHLDGPLDPRLRRLEVSAARGLVGFQVRLLSVYQVHVSHRVHVVRLQVHGPAELVDAFVDQRAVVSQELLANLRRKANQAGLALVLRDISSRKIEVHESQAVKLMQNCAH